MNIIKHILIGLILFPLVPFLALGDLLKAPYVCLKTVWMIWKGYLEYMAEGAFDFKDIQDYFFSTLFFCLSWYARKTGMLR